jgi:hypothetical protein
MAVDVGAIAPEATSVVGPFDAVNATVFMLDNPIAWAALSGSDRTSFTSPAAHWTRPSTAYPQTPELKRHRRLPRAFALSCWFAEVASCFDRRRRCPSVSTDTLA